MTNLDKKLAEIRRLKIVIGKCIEKGDSKGANLASNKLNELYEKLGNDYNVDALSRSCVCGMDDDRYVKELETVGYIIGIKL